MPKPQSYEQQIIELNSYISRACDALKRYDIKSALAEIASIGTLMGIIYPQSPDFNVLFDADKKEEYFRKRVDSKQESYDKAYNAFSQNQDPLKNEELKAQLDAASQELKEAQKNLEHRILYNHLTHDIEAVITEDMANLRSSLMENIKNNFEDVLVQRALIDDANKNRKPGAAIKTVAPELQAKIDATTELYRGVWFFSGITDKETKVEEKTKKSIPVRLPPDKSAGRDLTAESANVKNAVDSLAHASQLLKDIDTGKKMVMFGKADKIALLRKSVMNSQQAMEIIITDDINNITSVINKNKTWRNITEKFTIKTDTGSLPLPTLQQEMKKQGVRFKEATSPVKQEESSKHNPTQATLEEKELAKENSKQRPSLRWQQGNLKQGDIPYEAKDPRKPLTNASAQKENKNPEDPPSSPRIGSRR